VCVVLWGFSICQIVASPLLSEGFEGYSRGDLDANDGSGPNAAPNGGPGNPWWGPLSPDLVVVGAENGVQPHSGTNMVRGISAIGPSPDDDSDYYNLAYRLNGSNVFTGSIMLDWWFYDPVGATNGANHYADYVALAYFSNVPGSPDYNFGADPGNALELLSLGGSDEQDIGFDPTLYQAHVAGASDGYFPTGWFNTTTKRSVGWHHARIQVPPALGDGTSDASFFIDDMVNPTLTHNTVESAGFNCIALNARLDTTSAYYDDIAFDVLPPPTLQISAVGTNAIVTWPSGWILQSSSNLVATNFVDVTNAVSPYTNGIAPGGQQFFRLRN